MSFYCEPLSDRYLWAVWYIRRYSKHNIIKWWWMENDFGWRIAHTDVYYIYWVAYIIILFLNKYTIFFIFLSKISGADHYRERIRWPPIFSGRHIVFPRWFPFYIFYNIQWFRIWFWTLFLLFLTRRYSVLGFQVKKKPHFPENAFIGIP